MKEFLMKVLGICLIMSIVNPLYLFIVGATILAIVGNSYLEIREQSYKRQEEDLKKLAEDLRKTVKDLESEQGVLRLKLQNLINPGRKL